jgi:hypothetical protein
MLPLSKEHWAHQQTDAFLRLFSNLDTSALVAFQRFVCSSLFSSGKEDNKLVAGTDMDISFIKRETGCGKTGKENKSRNEGFLF